MFAGVLDLAPLQHESSLSLTLQTPALGRTLCALRTWRSSLRMMRCLVLFLPETCRESPPSTMPRPPDSSRQQAAQCQDWRRSDAHAARVSTVLPVGRAFERKSRDDRERRNPWKRMRQIVTDSGCCIRASSVQSDHGRANEMVVLAIRCFPRFKMLKRSQSLSAAGVISKRRSMLLARVLMP